MSLRSSVLLLSPLTLSLALVLAGCDRQTPDKAQPPSATQSAPSDTKDDTKSFNGTLDIASRGAAMPDFKFSDPAGQSLSSAELKGKPVLINLWATWCGPCVLEMPMLDGLAEKFRGRVTVLTISQDSGNAEKVARFFAEKQFRHLKPWLDPSNDLGFHYNTGLLPTTVLYDAAGKEVWRMVGAHDWSSARTDAMLADTLAK